jgi:hypothetical protein
MPLAKAQIVPMSDAAPAGGPWEDYQPPKPAAMGFGDASKAMLQGELEGRNLARQGVSPHAFSQYAPAKPQKLGDVEEYDFGPAYKGPNGELLRINPQTDFLANDPETGREAVFARHTAAAGREAEAQTNEGAMTRVAREIVPGLAVGPVTGIQRTLQGAQTAGTVGTRTGAALATERAANAVQDARAFENIDVRKFGPAFNQGPVASVAKQLAETPIIGAPVRNALEESMRDVVSAQGRIADAMAPAASVEQTGAALQRGLDRYRTSGIRGLEPGALSDLGVQPFAPGRYVGELVSPLPGSAPLSARRQAIVKSDGTLEYLDPSKHVIMNDAGRLAVYERAARGGSTMSAGAVERASQAQQARQAIGDVASAATSRGVPVAAARPLDQVMLARRSAEDMSHAELAQIIRAPSSETSFAARQEALFEHAWQQIPAKMKINNAANPDLMAATNTKNAFQAMAAAEAKAGISGGIVGGRFAGMADRVKTNVTLPTMKSMRTEIGRALSNFGIYDVRLDRTQLKQLYGAISRDIEIGVMDLANRARNQSQLGNNRADAVSLDMARKAEGALYALRRADRYTRMGMERMDRFSKVVGTENPQQAAGLLIRAALDGTKGNMQMLRTAVAVLRPEERNQLSALVFRELGKPQPSAGGIVQELGFSPESAMRRWQEMNPAARRLLFGGEQASATDDFARVVSRLANVEKQTNRSRSGTNTMNLTALVGSAGSIASGNFMLPLGVAGTGLAASILLSRPAYTRWMTTYAQLRAAALRAPINVTAPRILTHINRLGELAKRDQALLPVYRAIAAENGIKPSGDEEQPVENQPRLQ